jgi:hypothetical protein
LNKEPFWKDPVNSLAPRFQTSLQKAKKIPHNASMVLMLLVVWFDIVAFFMFR